MIEQLVPYIPLAAKADVEKLLKTRSFCLKITQARKTKRGDFRLTQPIPTITINNNLSKEQFLITLVHEIAHLHVYYQYKNAKPHGKEWKQCFKYLMLPFLNPSVFDDNLLRHLAKHFKNPKATTDSDIELSIALKEKNNIKDINKCFIFDLEPESLFQLNNRVFKVLNKKRTRFLCLEIKTKNKFLINGGAQVQRICKK